MRLKLTVHVVTTATFYGVEVDIPDDVVTRGEEAINEWVKGNKSAIDYAPVEHSETGIVQEVLGGKIEQGDEEFTIPDCRHSVDCAGRKTDESGYRVPGPEGDWKCFHVDHGSKGMLIPIFAGQQA